MLRRSQIWVPSSEGEKTMKARCVALAAVVVSIAMSPVSALEKGSRMVDSATVSYMSYKYMSVVRADACGQVALADDRSWALFVNGGAGMVTTDGTEDGMLWSVGGGVRYCLTAYNSIGVLASFEMVESGSDHQVVAGTINVEQRLFPPDQAVSPFLIASASVQNAKTTSWVAESDSFSALVIQGALGCEFALRRDCGVLVQGIYSVSVGLEDSPYSDYANGWGASVAIRYFWD